MTTAVRTPFGGPVVALADVPDPVFAGQLVGAGVAVVGARELVCDAFDLAHGFAAFRFQ